MQNIPSAEVLRDSDEVRRLLLDCGRLRSLRDPIASMVEELQFTPAQLHTLLWLGAEGALTMGEIAGRLGITEKTITGLVDRLESEGHLRRVRNEEDRRVVRAELTRKGTAAYHRFEAAIQAKFTSFLALLDPEERQTLIRILQKLRERLHAVEPRHTAATSP
jgi:DNA-binding MarR family transcriptional regulator